MSSTTTANLTLPFPRARPHFPSHPSAHYPLGPPSTLSSNTSSSRTAHAATQTRVKIPPSLLRRADSIKRGRGTGVDSSMPGSPRLGLSPRRSSADSTCSTCSSCSTGSSSASGLDLWSPRTPPSPISPSFPFTPSKSKYPTTLPLSRSSPTSDERLDSFPRPGFSPLAAGWTTSFSRVDEVDEEAFPTSPEEQGDFDYGHGYGYGYLSSSITGASARGGGGSGRRLFSIVPPKKTAKPMVMPSRPKPVRRDTPVTIPTLSTSTPLPTVPTLALAPASIQKRTNPATYSFSPIDNSPIVHRPSRSFSSGLEVVYSVAAESEFERPVEGFPFPPIEMSIPRELLGAGVWKTRGLIMTDIRPTIKRRDSPVPSSDQDLAARFPARRGSVEVGLTIEEEERETTSSEKNTLTGLGIRSIQTYSTRIASPTPEPARVQTPPMSSPGSTTTESESGGSSDSYLPDHFAVEREDEDEYERGRVGYFHRSRSSFHSLTDEGVKEEDVVVRPGPKLVSRDRGRRFVSVVQSGKVWVQL